MKTKTLLFGAMATMALALTSCGSKTQEAAPEADNSGAVIENIMTRTSVRKFDKEKPVEKEKVEQLLRAGMAAPTAMNRQPWHFIVIDDRAILDSLAQGNGPLETATLGIVVCGDLTKAGEGKAAEFWIQDTSAATENILLAAHALGLGAVWTAGYPMDPRVEALKKFLDLPDQIIPLCNIVIGYPAESPEPKDKWIEENVSYNKFGNR